MSVVLYGGAFDPVHAGHVFIAREALRLLAPSRLILIPTGSPNPEFNKRLSASDADRLAMLAANASSIDDAVAFPPEWL